jgi:serine phosphatase RsbU (regulator of sigma subunit)
MPQFILQITGQGEDRRLDPNPKGMLIGRANDCDIVLDSPLVSRAHARLFQDPLGRWVIEDLGSHNGVWAGGRKIQAASVSPGDQIAIGPFILTIASRASGHIAADPTVAAGTSLVQSSSREDLTEAAPGAPETLSGKWFKKLNTIGDSLSRLTKLTDLYPETCSSLADSPDITAAIIRLSRTRQQESPQTMAFSRGKNRAGQTQGGLRLSRRVIERVRSSGAAVLASNVRLCEEQLGLTVVGNEPLRAVCCAPIVAEDENVDALYLDVPPEEVDAGLLDFARALARQISFAKNSIHAAEESLRLRQLDEQIEMAKKIQTRLTPRLEGLPAGIDVALHYRPAMWVGGDYCDIWQKPEGKIAFAVGDVAGKGLPAAIAMANLHAALRMSVTFCTDLTEAVTFLNRHLSEYLPEGMFASLLLGVLDTSGGLLNYVNAGHLLPILIGPRDAKELGHPANPILGVSNGEFTQESVVLEAGSGIVVFTDGISEAQSPDGSMLGTEGVIKAVRSHLPGPSQEIVAAIVDAAEKLRAPLPQQDDITVLAMLRGKGACATGQAAPSSAAVPARADE